MFLGKVYWHIVDAQDEANHIFSIAYAIVEWETTSVWGFS